MASAVELRKDNFQKYCLIVSLDNNRKARRIIRIRRITGKLGWEHEEGKQDIVRDDLLDQVRNDEN